MGRFTSLVLCGILAASSLGGCGTVIATYHEWPEPSFLGGVSLDQRVAKLPRGGKFVLVDLPFSLVGDVVMLPVNFTLLVVQVQWEAALSDDDTAE